MPSESFTITVCPQADPRYQGLVIINRINHNGYGAASFQLAPEYQVDLAVIQPALAKAQRLVYLCDGIGLRHFKAFRTF